MVRPRSDIEPRIVHAARDRFLSEGVDGASLRQIAREAGTNIGMVYYYFPTKDDLFLAVVEEVYVALLADIEAALAPDAPVETRILRLYARVGAVTEAELTMIRLVVREALVSSARLERLLERFQRGHLPLLARLLQDGFSDGVFSAARSPQVVAMALLALGGPAQLLGRVLAGRLALIDGPRGPELAAELLDTLLRGVRS